MDTNDRYTVERIRSHWYIYDPNGCKIAEVCGIDELKNARLIVNGLNMRHRWLQKQGKTE